MGLLGFDPGTIGLEPAVTSSLIDPSDTTAGLFKSLIPFEQRLTEEATTTQAGQFGQLGGRFSRNAVDADTRLRGELGSQFERARQEALITANAQRNQAIANILNSIASAQSVGNQRLATYLNFLQPGAPNFQQGIFGDILGAAGNIAGILTQRGGNSPTAPPPNFVPNPTPSNFPVGGGGW